MCIYLNLLKYYKMLFYGFFLNLCIFINIFIIEYELFLFKRNFKNYYLFGEFSLYSRF